MIIDIRRLFEGWQFWIILAAEKVKSMKIRLFASALTLLSITACGDFREQPVEIYSSAMDSVGRNPSLESVTYNLLNAELESRRYISSLTAEEKTELLFDTLDEYYVKSADLRKEIFALAESAYSASHMHFIEKRTILYRTATEFYGRVKGLDELTAVKEIVEHYSKLSYVDGQRFCDPPADVRKRYKEAQDGEARAYSDAECRLSLQE